MLTADLGKHQLDRFVPKGCLLGCIPPTLRYFSTPPAVRDKRPICPVGGCAPSLPTRWTNGPSSPPRYVHVVSEDEVHSEAEFVAFGFMLHRIADDLAQLGFIPWVFA